MQPLVYLQASNIEHGMYISGKIVHMLAEVAHPSSLGPCILVFITL